jgi:putrescine transport system ATP-binding protein
MQFDRDRSRPIKHRPVNQTSPHIEIRGLTKRFGPILALNDINLTVDRGELFSLVGSSGCGKTTLLRALAGFVEPDAGQIVIGGQDMAQLAPYDRPVNMMFQSYALFPHMSVEDNIAFGLRREGLRGPEIRQRVGEALELIQMPGFARRKPQQLSGGQRQRVALARAVVKRPQVLLLDEPLSALDKKLRESTQFELVNIQEKLGITFIMVTHDQEEAMTMSTRIAVMSEGRIVQIGTPSEIYEGPCNRFVADFVGSLNLFDGIVVADSEGLATLRCDRLKTLLVAPGIGATLGSALAVGIRPERIALAPAGAPLERQNSFEGRVASFAFMGDRLIYHVDVAASDGSPGMAIKVTQANATGGSAPFARGDCVRLGWDAAASMLLRP